MTPLLQFVGIFLIGGLLTWAVIALDDWWIGRDAHRDCPICNPTTWDEPRSNLDRMDGLR